METIASVFTDTYWSPYAVGAGIGILSWLSFLISGKPIATSTTFARTGGMIENFITGGKAEQRPYYKKIKLKINWQWMLVVGVVLGSFLSAIISGDFQVGVWVPSLWASAFGDSAVLRVLVALAGASFWALAHALPVVAPAGTASAAHCNLPFQAGFRPSSFLSGGL
jgi:uncharacterized protein